MIALDTNVIVRYLTQDDLDQAQRASTVFERLTEDDPGFVPITVWAELFWVLTRTYAFGAADVVDRLEALSLADEIRAESAAVVARALSAAKRGADFADALIAATAHQAGCTTVVTLDRRAASKLGWQLS